MWAFTVRTLPSLRCSGLGVVPKKGNKWRMILHLSAPCGSIISDFISKESFSLQYSSVDDAVWFLVSLGHVARMAKVDLKSAFCMVPVHPHRTGSSWACGGKVLITSTLAFHSGYVRHHSCSTSTSKLCSGYFARTMGCRISSTTLTTTLSPGHQSLHYVLSISTSSCRCDRLGIPMALDKVDGPAITPTFLGLELDSVQ